MWGVTVSMNDTPAEFDRIVESIRRHHGLTLHPGQLQAGRMMLSRVIAEMATGEGKTASSLLTIALAAASGQRVFVATANDYLAHRDAEFAAPVIADFHGTVGCLHAGAGFEERQAAYRAQVVYGTIKEFVFDHLRDRLAVADSTGHPRAAIQPLADRLLIDEADSILIDEAATPCIVSGDAREYDPAVVSCLAWAAGIGGQLTEGIDYVDVPGRGTITTPVGRARIGALPLPSELASLTLGELFHWLELSLHACRRFRREVDYVLRDGEVVIVDESTGRISEGRQWSNGIHQAIEAREGVTVTPAQDARALLTIQEYVLRFRHISGMTGTGTEVRREFQNVFGLKVIQIPLNQPSRRVHLPNIACFTKSEKLGLLVDEVDQMHRAGRPALIGTPTVQASHELSGRLSERGLPHQVLNALNPELESPIIAQAGEPGRITVATNMAGRGTDIRLQGDSAARGGLHVIGSELHSARRIDRQLMGRCGRQGDPGSFRQFLSLEDANLSEAWEPQQVDRIRQRCRSASSIEKHLFAAQRRIEKFAAARRAQLCEQQAQRVKLLQSLGLDPVLNPIPDL
ncbi:hypothetical protein SH661x_003190 [Planctomicrobium sp. SH661]|uniref:preprotein translocase subunit SecA n=1 Tax=Planctomicrobium sp. SH661 TaxID=3448124 RepID=UPI003F5AF6D5